MEKIIYTVNMQNNIKTVHIKNNPDCYYSKPFNHIDFDSFEDLEIELKRMNKTYRKCENCFPKQYKN